MDFWKTGGFFVCLFALFVFSRTLAGTGFQARSKDQEILEEGGGAGPSTLPRGDHE